jgi:uncharacterized protein YdhG (YjbR/CyaY superfamily)
MTKRIRFSNIDDYIASTAPEARPILECIRRAIKQAVPKATECISYQIPAFKFDKPFIYFAGFKKHVGIYPPVKEAAGLSTELLPYRGEKGNLKFPLSKPMPYALIKRVASALARAQQRDSE